MENINQIYQSIAAAAGLNPPRLVFANMRTEVARYDFTTMGRGLKTRTTDEQIAVDLDKILSFPEIERELILAHELAHWLCRWKCIAGGDQTPDGGYHGGRFVAAWLWLVKRYGCMPLGDAAAWHREKYVLPETALQRAVAAAAAAENVDDAIHLARPPINKREELLSWLRFAAWSTLGLSLVAALAYNSATWAILNLGASLACMFLVFKIKRNTRPASPVAPDEPESSVERDTSGSECPIMRAEPSESPVKRGA